MGAIMMGGLGLGVLGASHIRHACDRTRRGARGWCKLRGLEVVGCDVRREGKRGGSFLCTIIRNGITGRT